jgi:hypothetical protein
VAGCPERAGRVEARSKGFGPEKRPEEPRWGARRGTAVARRARVPGRRREEAMAPEECQVVPSGQAVPSRVPEATERLGAAEAAAALGKRRRT